MKEQFPGQSNTPEAPKVITKQTLEERVENSRKLLQMLSARIIEKTKDGSSEKIINGLKEWKSEVRKALDENQAELDAHPEYKKETTSEISKSDNDEHQEPQYKKAA